MAKNSLLIDDASEESKSIFEESETTTIGDSELKELQNQCLRDLADNGGVIFEITTYPLKDTDEKIQGFRGYKVRSITADSFSFKKKGFLVVNNEVDLPLVRKRVLNNGPWYFFNREDCMEKYELLCTKEYETIQKEEERVRTALEEVLSAKAYMEELIANKRF